MNGGFLIPVFGLRDGTKSFWVLFSGCLLTIFEDQFQKGGRSIYYGSHRGSAASMTCAAAAVAR
jgi:hypothetical protein